MFFDAGQICSVADLRAELGEVFVEEHVFGYSDGVKSKFLQVVCWMVLSGNKGKLLWKVKVKVWKLNFSLEEKLSLEDKV